MDRIVLSGLQLYGYHGAYDAERTLGQRFVVDVSLGLDLRPVGTSDDLTRGVDYGAVYRVVREVVEGEAQRLLEAVAETLAAALLERFAAVEEVEVRLSKPSAPIKGAVFENVAVEITRRRVPR